MKRLKAETAAFELSQCESNIKFKESACTALGLSALDAYKPMHFPKPETYYTEIYKAYDKNPPQTVEDLDCHTELKEWFFEDMRAMTEAETDEEKIKEWSEDNSFAEWLEETIAHIRIKAIEEMEQARRYALKDTIKQAALPSNELLSRYAVTLDNELYKAIDAFNKAGT